MGCGMFGVWSVGCFFVVCLECFLCCWLWLLVVLLVVVSGEWDVLFMEFWFILRNVLQG